ncbi:phosphatidylinositol-3,4,5-tris phosphate 3-phosphatase PTEN [Acrasis kona]|uniref:Phosphatidylinositol 3,4,5-trisphosphate 3-phosphatase and dual-specificity protein phosphatase PTEN n=1 Tax=Acrasis kona TaxID=1008807 RepID=A0AAW2YLI6_9EUKA
MAYLTRRIVSKQKKRFQEEGFDLDLTCMFTAIHRDNHVLDVTNNVIAMGFPSTSVEGFYRNKLQDVVRFLETRHKGSYKVYNLCSEKGYDPTLFNNRVERFPFNDHNPCPFEMILPFCRSVDEWLKQNSSNVAIVHCKAGKGRTGLMICSYLMYSRQRSTAPEALSYYAETRTMDKQGVTIPSQIRYVKYFGEYLRNGGKLPHGNKALFIEKITISHYPKSAGQIQISVSDKSDDRIISYRQDANNSQPAQNKINLFLERVALIDDLHFVVKEKKLISTPKQLFHFWINVAFINNNYVTLSKLELDGTHRDVKHREYHKDFCVEIFFSLAPYPSSEEQKKRIRNESKYEPDLSSRDSDEYSEEVVDSDLIKQMEQEYIKNKR